VAETSPDNSIGIQVWLDLSHPLPRSVLKFLLRPSKVVSLFPLIANTLKEIEDGVDLRRRGISGKVSGEFALAVILEYAFGVSAFKDSRAAKIRQLVSDTLTVVRGRLLSFTTLWCEEKSTLEY
jgi:hypothetical protein